MNRPILNTDISFDNFKNYYWLKEELISLCKKVGIDHVGGKIEISKRIESFLLTGVVINKTKRESNNKHSNFDWNTEYLSLSTIITDNYRNTQNVRQFFTEQIGKRFSFNVQFMDWMKKNQGKTLQDAIIVWKKIQTEKTVKPNEIEIAPQFEYNRYIRAFLTDNPDKTIKDAIKCWKLKRDIKGSNEYCRTDLYLQ